MDAAFVIFLILLLASFVSGLACIWALRRFIDAITTSIGSTMDVIKIMNGELEQLKQELSDLGFDQGLSQTRNR